MERTEQQLKKLAHLSDDGQLILLNEIEDTKATLEKKIDSISSELNGKIEELSTQIVSIEIPEQKDHTKHMEKMMEMINEPIEVTLNII